MTEEAGSSTSRALSGALTAELIGTLMFTFSGTASVLAVEKLHLDRTFAPIDDIGIAIAFGFGVLAAVYSFARISGAHINPAVTVALATVREFPWRLVPPYVLAQLAGGIIAALMDWFMFGDKLRNMFILGSTHPGPGIGWGPPLLTEFVITAILMIVVMATAVYKRSPGGATTAGLAIGLWVAAAILLALPVSGGSLNPARTIGPDIVATHFPYWWVYIVGPLFGAIFGAGLWKFVIAKGRASVTEEIAAGGDAPTQQAA